MNVSELHKETVTKRLRPNSIVMEGGRRSDESMIHFPPLPVNRAAPFVDNKSICFDIRLARSNQGLCSGRADSRSSAILARQQQVSRGA